MKVWQLRCLCISLFAVVLHLLWEVAQCQPFFIHLAAQSTWGEMLLASLGDVILTWMDYGFVAVMVWNPGWGFAKWDRRHWLLMESAALVISISMEIYGLKSGRWAYTAWAPQLGGVSLLPVFQLLLLSPLIFSLARRLTQPRPR